MKFCNGRLTRLKSCDKRKICKHYMSPLHCEKCKKGINYLELAGGDRKGYITRLPCVTTSLSKNQVRCNFYQDPSDKEIKDFENWYESEMNKINKRVEKCTLR